MLRKLALLAVFIYGAIMFHIYTTWIAGWPTVQTQ